MVSAVIWIITPSKKVEKKRPLIVFCVETNGLEIWTEKKLEE